MSLRSSRHLDCGIATFVALLAALLLCATGAQASLIE